MIVLLVKLIRDKIISKYQGNYITGLDFYYVTLFFAHLPVDMQQLHHSYQQQLHQLDL